MTKATHSFQTEVNEVLSLVVNSLYSHKEVFLRELVSNASDALDRLSFAALTDHDLRDGDELCIDIIPSQDAGTLTLRDNGIGMTEDELIGNLGTIASSGSKKLMQSLTGNSKSDLSLIGQFGVGFYSSYLVADDVTVVTKAATSDAPAKQWESQAKGEFTIEDSEKEGRGTNVILHLKDDEKEFLDEWKIKQLIRKYSDYVGYPIRLQVERTKPVGDEKDEEGNPKQTETVKEWEVINSTSALWTRPKNEITDEQYAEFYKHLSHDWEPPLARSHFKVEGTQELTGLLFIPAKPPFDLIDRKPHGMRLFVKRVFIMEDCEELLPEWLRFIRGIVDSEDLPLNVSREILQQDRSTRMIRKQIVTRTLGMLEELANEGETTVTAEDGNESKTNRYEVFWQEFGPILKEGIHHDGENRERIAGLLRYAHSNDTDGGVISLKQYIEGMAEDQKAVYYVTAPSLDAARNSPHIEKLKASGFNVLLMADPIDEWVVQSLHEFDGKPLVAASKGSLDLPDTKVDEESKQAQAAQYEGLLGCIKNRLDDQVKDVRLTDRLTNSPACLVTEADGLSPHIEQLLRANGQEVPDQKRVLELNPDHPVVQRLQALNDDSDNTAEVEQWSELLLDQALVAEGSLPADPQKLARAISDLMEKAVGRE